MVTALRARAVEWSWPGDVVALRGVDLTLERGELLAVLGPNGAGKSTLLRALAGLLAVRSGTVELEGRALVAYSPKERARRLAVLLQSLPDLPDVRVSAFVLGGRYAHRRRFGEELDTELEIARAALCSCDVADLADRDMTELSGGQRQRVRIARALAQDADVLLVDEPTHSLDASHQIAVFDLLREQAARGRAVLVVTHDLNLAAQYATRAMVLKDGRVSAQGAIEEVFRPEVLRPVYGEALRFGEIIDDGSRVPFVLPWRTGREPTT